MNNKIGLCVIGYSRPNYLEQCLEHLDENDWGGAELKVVALDFKDEETNIKNIEVANRYLPDQILVNDKNIGVGKNKNRGMQYLLDNGCTDIFIMEDDILMLNPNTCRHYIKEARDTGVEHLNFALHGPLNKGHKKMFGKSTVYPHSVGAFSYYTSRVLNKVGLIDENFLNAWEHVHHTWRIANNNYTTPFWYFADHPQSTRMLQEIPGSIDNSSIRPRSDWKKNIEEGKKYWYNKHGIFLPPFPEGFY